jgi:hypothetical protein
METSGGSTPPISNLSSVDELTVIQVRIQGASEAVKRARFAFLVSTVASLAIFITEWNAYLSWYRHFPLSPAFPANEVTREAFKYVLQQFVEDRVITVSLLGIRVGVSDMAVLGSLTLLICSIWLFFSIRRHNHSVGSLLRDTKSLAPVVRRLVYYGASSSLVFTTVTAYDAAISSLEAEHSTREAKLTRVVVTVLFYLPAVVIALTIMADLLSVFFLNAVFTFPHAPLGFRDATLGRKVQFVAMELAAVGIGVPTFFLCRKIIDFEQSTGAVLREYAQLIG